LPTSSIKFLTAYHIARNIWWIKVSISYNLIGDQSYECS
jgi:hypothetical protein